MKIEWLVALISGAVSLFAGALPVTFSAPETLYGRKEDVPI
jgi:hypothetical protein